MASAIAPLAVGFLANKVVSQVTGNSKLGAIAGLAAGGLTGMGGLTGGSSGILGAGASQAAPAFGGTAATAAGANASGNALTNFIGRQFPLSDFGASAAGSAIKSSVAPNLSSAMFGGAGSPHAGMSAATPMNPAEFMGLGGPQVPSMQGFNTSMNAALPYGSPNPQAGIPVQPGLTAGNVMPADMFQTGFGEAGRGGFTGAQNQATNPYLFQDSTPASMFEMGEPQLMFPTNSPISSMPQNTANVSLPQSMGNVPAQAPAPAPAPTQQWNPADYAPDDLQIYQSDMAQPAPAQPTGMDQRYNLNPNVRKPDVERLSSPNNEVPQTYDEFNLDTADGDFGLNSLSGASVGNTPLIGVGTEVNGASGSTYSPTPDYNPAAVESQVMGAGAPPAPVQAPSGAMGEAGRTLPVAQNTSPNPYVDGTPSSMFDYDSIEPATAASNIQRAYEDAGARMSTGQLARSAGPTQQEVDIANKLSDEDNIMNSMKAFGQKALDWLKENPDMIKFLGAAALSLLAKKKEEEKGGGGGGVQFGPMASAYAGTGGGGGGQAPLGFGLAQRKGYTPQAI